MKSEFKITVPELDSKKRLDVFIFEYLNGLDFDSFSRSEIQTSIASGLCSVNNKPILKSGSVLKGSEEITISIEVAQSDVVPDPTVEFGVLYEDEYLLVIDKPAGLVVHPAPGVKGSTLVHGILGRLSKEALDESPERPGIVHRLDKDTSGVMVVAKTAKAKRHLQNQLKAPRTMKRIYHAICLGVPKVKRGVRVSYDEEQMQVKGTITASIDRHPHKRIRYIVSESSEAREAISHYRVLKAKDSLSLIEFTLETGRTHQIRVHAEYASCPILGDPVYGPVKSTLPKDFLVKFSKIRPLERQMLHAHVLSFIHPETGDLLEFKAEYPSDFIFP